MVDENILKELEEFLPESSEIQAKRKVKIIKDKKQFSIRIPTSFARSMELDVKKHVFVFELVKPKMPSNEKPVLTGRVVEI